MVIAATQNPKNIFGKNCFADVREEWFAPFVCAAARETIVGGFGDGTFRPAQNITMIEAIKVVVRAFGFQSWGEPIWEKKFLDIENPPLTMLDFHADLTREKAVGMIYRLLW